MLNLKGIIDGLGVTHRAVAEAAGISPSALSQLLHRNMWPKKRGMGEVKTRIEDFLLAHGATRAGLRDAFVKAGARKEDTNYRHQAVSAARPEPTKPQEGTMLIRRQGLFPETRKHFQLARNPFLNDVQSVDDIFKSADIRYVREALYDKARHGGFMALSGESGSGKTVLRRELLERLQGDGLPVQVIEPYVLGMEDSEARGKALRSSHIAEAILSVVAPLDTVPSSPEARFRAVHKKLQASKRAGNSHVLIIEEAHSLPVSTLKHLKRYLELTDGLASLLGIILIGQSELKTKLDESNYEVREVVQRCELVELPPLRGDDLAAYLKFKFARVGIEDLGQVITEDGIEALRDRLTGPASLRGSRDSLSLVYPLAVNNLTIAALNVAAEVGAPVVDAAVVKRV